MNKIKISTCPVCNSNKISNYITTNALMHQKNDEQYNFKKCEFCQSVFLSNPVQESDLGSYYSDNYLPYRGAAAWGKYSSFVNKSQKKLDSKRVKLVYDNTNKNKVFSILDVGCGNPSFLKTIKIKLNADCTGIDFSDNGWKQEKTNNIILHKSTIAAFNPEQKFDIITLWHYLEHDYNLHETVEKLFSCLNSKGRLIIEVPDYDTILAKRQKQFWQGWHSPRHLTLFSKEGFRKLFIPDKWAIIKHRRHGTLDAFTLWWLGNMEKKSTDWSGSMEGEFWRLVFLKVISSPFFLLEKIIPMGIQTIIIEKK